MSLFFFLTVLQAIVAAALVGVILMQKSEGGGLGLGGGGGGGPGGMLSARGAGDFLTRTTAILAVTFVALSIVLAAVAVGSTSGQRVESTLDRTTAPVQPVDPLAGVESPPAEDVPAQSTASDDPLAGVAE